ncbi:HP1 family phage holin [Vibrio cholerae]|uniref:HP1 family phage holin n=1 Tax=Vibrio cholerae TaxID=666 RepID=UPI003CD03E9A
MQEKISSFCSYLTAGVFAGFGALTLQDWVSLLGLLFVALTYFTNRYYKKSLTRF